MHETSKQPTSALVVRPQIRKNDRRDPASSLQEAIGLASAIGLDIRHSETVRVSRISAATLLGEGQVNRLKEIISGGSIQLAVIDHALSPGQQRNLERAWNCKVIDRTGLILEIFGERARTREGQLQVELAALTYQRSRLVRSWTHLERQRASGMGAGFLGGPGESQLELDRRLIDARLDRIKQDLKEVRRTRSLQRRARTRRGQKQVALVGYTNAGKSTLFNLLTSADVLAKDMLFATLDPTLRKLQLGPEEDVMLADTVGFISDLPTSLVEAFRATLEEVTAADLILHIRDAADADTQAQRDDVLNVLADLGIKDSDPRLVEVLNKVDLLPADDMRLLTDYKTDTAIVSALTGQGVDHLQQLIRDKLFAARTTYDLIVPFDAGETIAWLYEHGEIESRQSEADGEHISASLSTAAYDQYLAMLKT